jgi:ABC-type transporter Mla subunit MlaD
MSDNWAQGDNWAKTLLKALDDHTLREEAKLTAINANLDRISDILSYQKGVLETHIARSERLENLVDIEKDKLDKLHSEHVVLTTTLTTSTASIAEIAAKIEPLTKNLSKWAYLGQLVLTISALTGAIYGIIQFLR